ncbi:flagellar biosynthesis anti-sigma factor FlgM [Aliibacillus thermotolerans]|uniref:Negative regulator of flagellin synthesis n=1 Tax=Aliibacillus thermotolerans TaxID=1834418 RepID=A0ABW0U5L8_9BACI|nr:flagellar biosynthesis anti-sigma factor FlgM [Aliibacillus thermotolerans]
MNYVKINPLGPTNPYHRNQSIQRPEKENHSRNERDKVEISKEAQHMQQGPDIRAWREEKVEAVKRKVESGSYEVNPKEVARRFYEFWTGK